MIRREILLSLYQERQDNGDDKSDSGGKARGARIITVTENPGSPVHWRVI